MAWEFAKTESYLGPKGHFKKMSCQTTVFFFKIQFIKKLTKSGTTRKKINKYAKNVIAMQNNCIKNILKTNRVQTNITFFLYK